MFLLLSRNRRPRRFPRGIASQDLEMGSHRRHAEASTTSSNGSAASCSTPARTSKSKPYSDSDTR
ncbi:MAG: hypothetical protein MZU97_00625 [Bacillus subtilis]|nr:hypothetical protein [Bacillus subtilis]